MSLARRQVLMLFLSGAALSAGISGLLRNRAISLETQPLRGVPGYSYLVAGAASGGLPDPFFGIDDGSPDLPPADLDWLFTAPVPGGAMPVASFSDYNCPYCRILSKLLMEEAREQRIAVTWHELPLLGPRSTASARAALAAGLQGGYLPMHERMMGGRLRLSETGLKTAADEMGLDADRMMADMSGPEVNQALLRSAALAEMFGIIGTPALIVGRVLVLGEIKQRDLRALIEMQAG